MGVLEGLGIKLLWFDSLGAKSASLLIDACGEYVVIDPGAAAMQPSYPLPSEEKLRLRDKALRVIESACYRASVIIITHYHYDHHVRPSQGKFRDPAKAYLGGKTIVAKDPNKYINESQWVRAREFFRELIELSGGEFRNFLSEPLEESFRDPTEELRYALSRDFGDYSSRRAELLRKGRRWFEGLVRKLWSSSEWVIEGELPDGTKLVWGEGRSLRVGCAKLKFLKPHFHGIEYDRTGWVMPVIIELSGKVVIYTSDLMGPQIEDYAYEIISHNPDVVIADGPPTYLYPYMLNRINLRRAIENMELIIREARPELVIYDHHLLRERRWRVRVAEVFEVAKEVGTELLTAAEYLGEEPLIDRVSREGSK